MQRRKEHDEWVYDRATTMQLQRQIEALVLCCLKKSGKLLKL